MVSSIHNWGWDFDIEFHAWPLAELVNRKKSSGCIAFRSKRLRGVSAPTWTNKLDRFCRLSTIVPRLLRVPVPRRDDEREWQRGAQARSSEARRVSDEHLREEQEREQERFMSAESIPLTW